MSSDADLIPDLRVTTLLGRFIEAKTTEHHFERIQLEMMLGSASDRKIELIHIQTG